MRMKSVYLSVCVCFSATLVNACADISKSHSLQEISMTFEEAQFVTRPDGAQISYYTSGAKPKNSKQPRIVLMASLGRSVIDFEPVLSKLSQTGHRIVAVDFRGVNRSKFAEPPSKKINMYNYVDDAFAVVTADGGDEDTPIYVVGHAYGNRVARAFATKFDHQVKGIVLLAAGGSQNMKDDPKLTKSLADCFDRTLSIEDRKKAISYVFFSKKSLAKNGGNIPQSWLQNWYQLAAKQQVLTVNSTPVESWRSGGGKAPILILQAGDDRVAPAETTSLKIKSDFGSRVKIVNVEQAGHALLPEQPEIIGDEILAFVNTMQSETIEN